MGKGNNKERKEIIKTKEATFLNETSGQRISPKKVPEKKEFEKQTNFNRECKNTLS